MALSEELKAKVTALLTKKARQDGLRKEAQAYLRAAAEAGHVEAQFCLAESLSEGEQDRFGKREALRLFRKAAERGHMEAQFRLGEWLYHDYDHTDDENAEDPMGLLTEAVEWLRCAAGRGHCRAMVFLADPTYEELGESSGLKEPEVVGWLRRAADRGHVDAQFMLGRKLIDGEFSKYDVPESRTALGEGRTWLERAAEQGHAEAQYQLGLLCDESDEETQRRSQRDVARAEALYRRAAEQGHVGAAQRLLLLRRALATPGSRELSDQQVAETLFHEAEECENSEVVEKRGKALALYGTAGDLGHVEAQFRTGWLYAKGNGDPFHRDRDLKRAAMWYRRAAEQGHPAATVQLAQRLNEFAQSIEEDGGDASKWYQEALGWLAKAEKNPPADARFQMLMPIMRCEIEAALRGEDEASINVRDLLRSPESSEEDG
jgi:TPR repeat protein